MGGGGASLGHMGGGGGGEVTEVMDVPADKIGRLIGRGGATIQAIQARGGSRIKIEHAAAGGTKPVSITGTAESVAQTKALCQAALENGNIDGVPGGGVGAGYGGMPGAPAGGGHMTAGAGLPAGVSLGGGEPSSKKITCPAHIIGRIIGRGGETIRSLQVGLGYGSQFCQKGLPLR